MSDGKVVIDIILNDGSVVKGVSNIDKQMNSLNPSAQKATRGIKDIVTALGLVKLASAGFDMLKNSLDAAISRFDTMQRYPKVMKALGFSTEESNTSVKKLADGIDGLPTKLDEVVSTSQRMTAITGNMNKSTDATIALNNAMLASGASTADANRGMDQYIQMLTTGQVDLQSWKTLQETMPIGLQKTAEAMGFVGETAQRDLYSALKDGNITFKDFQNQLIKLGTGTGELAELARVNSEGIATSFGNLKNAAAKGIANIITDIDNLSKAVTGKNIAKNLDGLKVIINKSFEVIGKTIKATTPLFILSADALKLVFDAGKNLSPVLVGLAAGYGALKIIQGINSLIIGSHAALQMAAWSGKALTIVTQAKMAAQIADTNATKADIIAKSAQNGVISISTALVGVLTGGISASTVAATLATAATTAFSTALQILTGPIGWVIGGITLLTTGAVALWKWFNKESEATKAVRDEQEDLIKSTDELVKLNGSNAQARKDEVEGLQDAKSNYQALIKEMDMLTSKEKLSNSEKKRAKEIVEELNSKLGDLNLVYDEQSNKLSELPAKIQQQVDAYAALDEASSAQQRINDMLEQRNNNEAKLMEISIARDRWNETLKKSSGNTKEAKESLAQMNEEEQKLMEAQGLLQAELIKTADDAESSLQRAATATEGSVLQQTVSYDALQGKNKEVMDALRAEYQSLEEKVGNAFDAIEQKQAISTEKMIENLQKNQEATAQWSENIKVLAERGVDEGLLEQLRKMGPEGAAQAAALVNSSQNELDKLNEVFRNTGETSLNAMKEGLQLGEKGVTDEIALIIPSQKETLVNQLAQANFGDIGKSAVNDINAGVENGRATLDESMKGIVSKSESTIKEEVKAADFSGIGLSIPQGIGKGVENGKDNAIKEAVSMTDGMIDGAKKSLDTHSPSKVFHEIGENVAEGLSNGVNQSINLIDAAINNLTNSIKTPFDNVNNEMFQIGAYAMQGFENGLISNAGSVYSTAQSIANNVKNTIQSALDIHSPSRWMKNFIARNMMMGWSDGLEQYSSLPVQAMKKASNMVKMPVLKAESIVGSIPSLNNQRNNTVSETTNQTTNNRDYRGLFDGAVFNWNNKDDIRQMMQEIAWMTEVEKGGGLT